MIVRKKKKQEEYLAGIAIALGTFMIIETMF
jgi:hypothetical protein